MEMISISPAVEDDASGIAQVRRITWLNTYPNKEYDITVSDIQDTLNTQTVQEEVNRIKKRITDDSTAQTWVAKNDKEVVGFITALKRESKNKIGAMYILPQYQNKGIGSQLMHQVFEWFGPNQDITLEVALYNHSAINFYKKFNFVKNGPSHNPVGKLPSGKEIPQVEMIRKF